MTAVLIDGRPLSDGSQLRGIGTYLRRILAGLAEQPDLSLTVLCAPGAVVPPNVATLALGRRLPDRVAGLEHALRVDFALRRHHADVFFSTAEDPPRRSPIPWIQTLHDLIPLTRPDPLTERDRRHWLRVGGRIRQAAAVISHSRFSADEGIRHLSLDPRRVHVVPPGVDPDRFHPGAAMDQEQPYLLHVTAWGPHKGFAEAVAVIDRLADRGLPHRLVMAGPQDAWMRAQIERIVGAGRHPERVELAGYVDDLAAAYRGATALLMSTRCEGFGLPALEAMACGTPVVAFDNSSLPEVVGDAGLLVPDGDVTAMADAVIGLIESPDRRAVVAERCLERSRRFRWSDTVAAYVDVLRDVSS